MNNLFVYGSLMFDAVWCRLISTDYQYCDASLHGYKRLNIKNEVYPALVPASNHKVAGKLIFNINNEDMKLLDQFEGSQYHRARLTVLDASNSKHTAEVYVFNQQYVHLLLDTEWSPVKFGEQNMQVFLSCYTGF